jgi:hypothetical protein
MITIYKYHLDRDQIHIKSRNAHVLEFLSVQIQRDEITLWALVDTEKPANYADIWCIGTGWHLGKEKPEWATKANFIDTVQDPDGLVWHIFGVLPEDKKEEKATERQQVQEQKAAERQAEIDELLNNAKEKIEKRYVRDLMKGYVMLMGDIFDLDFSKELENFDEEFQSHLEKAYREIDDLNKGTQSSNDCNCESCKCHESTDGATSRSNNDGARKTAPAEHAKATEYERISILRSFIEKAEQDK